MNPLATPPLRVVRMEDPLKCDLSVKGTFHDWGPDTNHPTRVLGTGWRIPFQPKALSGPGNHGHQLCFTLRLGHR